MKVQENLQQRSMYVITPAHPTPLYHMKTSKKRTKRWSGFQPVGMNYNTHTNQDQATVWRIQRNIYIYIQKIWLNQAESNSDFKLKSWVMAKVQD